ncbi:MAG: LysR substrate-binding domain-containing protein [Erythrobacter sp.]|uniref:LysR family transcriptional regulator n=1 Tax=Erythrobacter sp. TaxID=1042 RepID=UPI003A871EB8
MVDLNALPIFARVAETLSFSEAARQLHIPVSTVSRKVADLEDDLGVQLIERTTRKLRLTDIGLEVLYEAQRSTETGEAIQAIVSNRLASVRGRISLSAPPSISDSLLSPLLTVFQSTYPDVQVRVLLTDRMVDHIVDGIDLALRVGHLQDSSLVARPLLTYRHRLVASPDYLARNSAPESPQDLRGHRLLAFGLLTPRRSWSFSDGKRDSVIDFEPTLSMNDYGGLADALMLGAGIGDLPPIVRPELLANGKLVEVMPNWRFASQPLSMVRLAQRYVPKPLRLFMEMAIARVPGLFPNLPI